MELMRLGEPGQELPVARDGGKYFDLRSLTEDINDGFLADDGIARVQAALKDGLSELADAEFMRIGAAVARSSAVLCIGQTYPAHAVESGDAPPSIPILFFEHPNTVVGAFDHVVIPPDAEGGLGGGLAVVIGKRASYLASPDEALD